MDTHELHGLPLDRFVPERGGLAKAHLLPIAPAATTRVAFRRIGAYEAARVASWPLGARASWGTLT